MSAESAYDNDFGTFGAHRARLNLASWPPGYRANYEPLGTFLWVKVNLDESTVITGIASQGYGNSTAAEWVSEYMVFYQKGNELALLTEVDGETEMVSVKLIILLTAIDFFNRTICLIEKLLHSGLL